jgi:prophage regulatory protein
MRDTTRNTYVDPIGASRLLSWAQVRARVPLSRATVWTLRRRGTFPKPIQISPNRIAWRASDLDAWIAARAEQ